MRWLAGLGMSAMLAAAGCSVVGTSGDRQTAEQVASEHFPGQLTVVGVRNLFPEDSGSEVTFALKGDPDAAVRLRIDADKGTCRRKPCGEQLKAAVAHAKAQGDDWRRLADGFRSCGHPLVAADWQLGEVWVEGAPTNATVKPLLTALGGCLPDERALSVSFAVPEVVAGLPATDAKLPTLLRVTDGKRLAALAGRAHVVASYAQRADRTAPPVVSARVVRPFAERQEFEKKVKATASAWLLANRPNAAAVHVVGIWRLEPGTVDRLAGYVLFCEPAQKNCQGDRALAMTVDREGALQGGPQIVTDVRDPQGVLRLPGPG
jgi:hypothetical protein